MDVLKIEYPANTNAVKQETLALNTPKDFFEVTETALTGDHGDAVKDEKPAIGDQPELGWDTQGSIDSLLSATFGDPIVIAPLKVETSEPFQTADTASAISVGASDKQKCEQVEPISTGVMVAPQPRRSCPHPSIGVGADQADAAQSATLDQHVPSTKENIPDNANLTSDQRSTLEARCAGGMDHVGADTQVQISNTATELHLPVDVVKHFIWNHRRKASGKKYGRKKIVHKKGPSAFNLWCTDHPGDGKEERLAKLSRWSASWSSASSDMKQTYVDRAREVRHKTMDPRTMSDEDKERRALFLLDSLGNTADTLVQFGYEVMLLACQGPKMVVGGSDKGTKFLSTSTVSQEFMIFCGQPPKTSSSGQEEQKPKDNLRQEVQALLNAKYSNFIRKKTPFPYAAYLQNKANFRVCGLPHDVTIRLPSYMGLNTLRDIMSAKDTISMEPNAIQGPAQDMLISHPTPSSQPPLEGVSLPHPTTPSQPPLEGVALPHPTTTSQPPLEGVSLPHTTTTSQPPLEGVSLQHPTTPSQPPLEGVPLPHPTISSQSPLEGVSLPHPTTPSQPPLEGVSLPHTTTTSQPPLEGVSLPHPTTPSQPPLEGVSLPHTTTTSQPPLEGVSLPHPTTTSQPPLEGVSLPHPTTTSQPLLEGVPLPHPTISSQSPLEGVPLPHPNTTSQPPLEGVALPHPTISSQPPPLNRNTDSMTAKKRKMPSRQKGKGVCRKMTKKCKVNTTVTDVMPGDHGDRYAVENIVDHQYLPQGENLYLIKWQGYTSDANTWEPECNIDATLLASYNNT